MDKKLEMEFHLPEELLRQILVKLRAKSLLRFRCVCKSWYSLISSFNFIESHLNHNQNSGEYNMLFKQLLTDHDNERYSVHADTELFQELETLDFPFKNLSIVGCVNGLVCLWDNNNNSNPRNANYNVVMLWNPCIRRFFVLPKFFEQPTNHNPIDFEVFNTSFGFGYDASSKDFKVLRVIQGVKKVDDALTCDVLAKVFSLSTKSWRTLDDYTPVGLDTCSCNVGNFVYICSPNGEDSGFEIVPFDLSAEVFTTPIACPEEILSNWDYQDLELINFRDSLAVLHQWDCKRYHIWVMRGDGVAESWSKIFSVDIDGGVLQRHIIGFTPKGVMLVLDDGNLLVSPGVEHVQVLIYTHSSSRIKDSKAWQVESFKESLILLKEGDILPLSPPNLGNANQLGSSEKLEWQSID